MILAMLLAHLVGDYILQWDDLSRWKSEALSGVLVHGFIVIATTWLFSLPFDTNWWPWVILIGLSHTLIDALELPLRRRLASQESGASALALFVGDQTIHVTIIGLALYWSGHLAAPTLAAATKDNQVLAYLLGYAFLTMPAWIIIRFIIYGFMNGSAPDFSRAAGSKYASMVERGLIATLVMFGQFLLVPLVALPRLLLQWSQVSARDAGNQTNRIQCRTLYVAELLISASIAVAIGLALRQL